MKINKSTLKQLIREAIEESYGGSDYTPEQRKVADAMSNLIDLIYDMENSDPEMTDLYIAMLRGLRNAGVNIKALAMMV